MEGACKNSESCQTLSRGRAGVFWPAHIPPEKTVMPSFLPSPDPLSLESSTIIGAIEIMDVLPEKKCPRCIRFRRQGVGSIDRVALVDLSVCKLLPSVCPRGPGKARHHSVITSAVRSSHHQGHRQPNGRCRFNVSTSYSQFSRSGLKHETRLEANRILATLQDGVGGVESSANSRRLSKAPERHHEPLTVRLCSATAPAEAFH